jgi:hypothetical protein
MDHRPACSLCLHSCDERWVGDGIRSLCTSCLMAIGRFVSDGSGRAGLWPSLETEPANHTPLRTQVDDEPVPDRVADLSKVFVDLTQSLDGVAVDAEIHVGLAIAYREMGLVGDALMNAAVALRHEKRLSRSSAREAMSLLLDARHLRVGVDELLVALRNAMFTI